MFRVGKKTWLKLKGLLVVFIYTFRHLVICLPAKDILTNADKKALQKAFHTNEINGLLTIFEYQKETSS